MHEELKLFFEELITKFSFPYLKLQNRSEINCSKVTLLTAAGKLSFKLKGVMNDDACIREIGDEVSNRRSLINIQAIEDRTER